jgi:hypothetical protein
MESSAQHPQQKRHIETHVLQVAAHIATGIAKHWPAAHVHVFGVINRRCVRGWRRRLHPNGEAVPHERLGQGA